MPVLPGVLRAIYSWLAELDVSWAQELCIYMFIWMAKFGAAYGVRTGIHVGVDVLVNLLPPQFAQEGDPVRPSVRRVLHRGDRRRSAPRSSAQMFETGQQSNDLEWPMWFIYSAIPLGSGLMCFRFLQVSWWYYWTGDLPHHSEAQVEGIAATDALHPSTDLHGTVPSRWSNPLALALILAPILILAICFRVEGRRDRAAAVGARDHDLHPADRVHGHRHAGVDLARPHGAHLPVRAERRADRGGVDEAVHRPRKLRDHGDPVLHPGRRVPQPRRRRAPDDQFRGVADRPLARRAGARRHRRLLDVRPGVRIERRHRGGDRRDRAARDGAARLPDAVRRRHHHGGGLARHPDAAVDPEDRLRGLDQHLDRRAVRRRPAARLAPHRHAVRGDLVPRPTARLSARGESELAANPGAPSAKASGA